MILFFLEIEHDYNATLDLAYIWACNKCDERRIRFYDIPPTENQRGKHLHGSEHDKVISY